MVSHTHTVLKPKVKTLTPPSPGGRGGPDDLPEKERGPGKPVPIRYAPTHVRVNPAGHGRRLRSCLRVGSIA